MGDQATTDQQPQKTSGHRQDAFPQVVPHQAEAGQGPEAEQAHPPVDSPEDWQHHQVQRQEKALAQDPYRYLSDSPTMPEQDAHVRGRPSHHNYHFNQLSDRTGEIGLQAWPGTAKGNGNNHHHGHANLRSSLSWHGEGAFSFYDVR